MGDPIFNIKTKSRYQIIIMQQVRELFEKFCSEYEKQKELEKHQAILQKKI